MSAHKLCVHCVHTMVVHAVSILQLIQAHLSVPLSSRLQAAGRKKQAASHAESDVKCDLSAKWLFGHSHFGLRSDTFWTQATYETL